MNVSYSFIIPVYNRPDEIDELLMSLTRQDFNASYEIVIVEDGSTKSSEHVIKKYTDRLQISYYYKENSGPGDSRNYGMQRAKGNYFLILDSDCVLPKHYLKEVDAALKKQFAACFGGPDAAHESFTNLQKAINYTMTSFLTTGGIRGSKKSVNKFQPRSFNMGLSKKAFKATGGFGKIHPGEDPDLTIRLWKLGFNTAFIPEAYVYHKRRISWGKFYQQVQKFGKCRPILNYWHPETKKITYWFPTFFILSVLVALLASLVGIHVFTIIVLSYLMAVFIDATIKNRNIRIGFQSVLALFVQFFGYGLGFLIATIKINILTKKPEEAFPYLFFN